MTHGEYQILTSADKIGRDHFGDLYKAGLDRLCYNATQFYYHKFTNSTRWMTLTIRVMNFDPMSADDYIGSVVISLLIDLSDSPAVISLKESRP